MEGSAEESWINKLIAAECYSMRVNVTFHETSGGETSETIRTPDDVIGVFGTPAQRDNQYTTIHHIASSHSELFKKVDVHALFGNSYFTSAD